MSKDDLTPVHQVAARSSNSMLKPRKAFSSETLAHSLNVKTASKKASISSSGLPLNRDVQFMKFPDDIVIGGTFDPQLVMRRNNSSNCSFESVTEVDDGVTALSPFGETSERDPEFLSTFGGIPSKNPLVYPAKTAAIPKQQCRDTGGVQLVRNCDR